MIAMIAILAFSHLPLSTGGCFILEYAIEIQQ